LVGLVTDGPTLYDHAYNQNAWAGVKAGAVAIKGRTTFVVSQKPADYAANIRSLVRRGASAVVTVGFNMTKATIAAAKAYSRVQFIGIDQQPALPLPRNYQALDFDRAQEGYMAGIVAGWATRTDKVGAVGGMAIAPVFAFINGFRNGVASVHSTTTVVVRYTNSFDAPALGAAAANAMIANGADVVFGVAGKTNAGIIQAACATGAWAIGVDVDQYLQYPDLRSCILVSAVQRISTATSKAIQRWWAGRPRFQTGIYLNDASNLAMPLSPIRNTTPPAGLLTALATAYAGMKADTLDPCWPIACTRK
jgi:basic membrane protein A